MRGEGRALEGRAFGVHLLRYLANADWGNDTVAQFNKNVHDVNAPCDWVSGHIYAGSSNLRWNITDPNSPESESSCAHGRAAVHARLRSRCYR